ncbi:MAG: UDP-N-acetylmuramate--L-alanine ligase [Coraliomargaritaceae bacterium]
MRIYFMGICGSAMGNVACLLKEQGHTILGSDLGAYPPMSEVLAKADIPIIEGFDANRLAGMELDLVVVGNAMSRGNPEVEWLLEQSTLPYVSLPELCREHLLKEHLPVVVTGTHGKTTTSTLTAYLLESAGECPGWLIGGVPRDLPGGSKLGHGKAFVIEGDEYDSAFFDKRSKFIHYRPKIAILNNLEFDHADIFRDLTDVKRTFMHFTRIVPASGYAIFNGDDPNLAELLPVDWTQCLRVGTGEGNDLQIEGFADGTNGSSFSLIWQGRLWARIDWRLHGLFNARNAAMAGLAAALVSGHEDPTAFSLHALGHFQGVARRQDELFKNNKWIVLEDFAHHPTAIAGALEALRAAHPDRPIYACFEPRSNTAVGAYFQSEFTEALSKADFTYLGPVYRSERMRAEERLDTATMAKELIEKGRPARHFSNNQDILNCLREHTSRDTSGLIVFFSNGSFDGIQHALCEALEQGSEPTFC